MAHPNPTSPGPTDAPASPGPASTRLGARAALLILGGAALAAAALLPFDGAISRMAREVRPGGDVRRELELVQQFGGPTSIALAALLLWRLDPARLRRVLDWLAALALALSAAMVIKILAGRPRPKFDEPLVFLGPGRSHVVQPGDPARYPWEITAPDITEIWSMPSSHTASAVVAAVFLTALDPRLRPVVWGLALAVGACRVLFRAHYVSDVIVGGALAYVLARLVIDGYLGVRGLDRVWRGLFGPTVRPALPSLLDAEARARSRRAGAGQAG